MRKISAALLTIALALGLTACGQTPAEAPADREIFAMDTVMEVSAWGDGGEAAVEETEQMLYDLDALLSRTREESQVWVLNHGDHAPVEPDQDLAELLVRAEHYSRETHGAFDITIAPVVEAWNFTGEEPRVPSETELTELLGHVGMYHVHWEEDGVFLDPGTEIDLGGIAKGYASDRVTEIYTTHEVPRGLAYLGGNMLAWGNRPDGTPWRIGIQDPANPEGYLGVLQLENAFAITSGGYQRFFERDGRIYHHIVDPSTGYPADSGLTSVTVVADSDFGNGTMCDALSTALFVMGEEDALNFWRDRRDRFDLVLVTEDGRVLVTAGLEDRFQQAEGSDYIYETVS